MSFEQLEKVLDEVSDNSPNWKYVVVTRDSSCEMAITFWRDGISQDQTSYHPITEEGITACVREVKQMQDEMMQSLLSP